jgi:hypothetical protein
LLPPVPEVCRSSATCAGFALLTQVYAHQGFRGYLRSANLGIVGSVVPCAAWAPHRLRNAQSPGLNPTANDEAIQNPRVGGSIQSSATMI